jgi:hypothetical protein
VSILLKTSLLDLHVLDFSPLSMHFMEELHACSLEEEHVAGPGPIYHCIQKLKVSSCHF